MGVCIRWSSDDLRFINENHKYMTAREMADHLNVDLHRVENKLSKCGLRCRLGTKWPYYKYDEMCKLARNRCMNWALENRIKGRILNF